jgi:hypothetical protein
MPVPVLGAHQVRPFDVALQHAEDLLVVLGRLPLLAVHLRVERRQELLQEDEGVVRPGAVGGGAAGGVGDEPFLVLDLNVQEVGVDAEGEVRGEGPRSGRPRQQRRALEAAAARDGHDGKVDDDGRVVDLLVVEVRLEVAERRAAGHAVGHHLVALVDELLLVELLEDPPHGLHEGLVHGLVVVLKVDPAP